MTHHDLVRTHGREEPAHANRQPFSGKRIQDPVALAALGHQLRRLEDGQVPGDGRAADREPVGDLPGGKLAVPEIFQDLASGRIRQGPKRPGLVVIALNVDSLPD
nr:hypothetical protein [Catenulispora pinisilvae]